MTRRGVKPVGKQRCPRIAKRDRLGYAVGEHAGLHRDGPSAAVDVDRGDAPEGIGELAAQPRPRPRPVLLLPEASPDGDDDVLVVHPAGVGLHGVLLAEVALVAADRLKPVAAEPGFDEGVSNLGT